MSVIVKSNEATRHGSDWSHHSQTTQWELREPVHLEAKHHVAAASEPIDTWTPVRGETCALFHYYITETWTQPSRSPSNQHPNTRR